MNRYSPSLQPFFYTLLFVLFFGKSYAQVFPAPGTDYTDAPVITCLDGYTWQNESEIYLITIPGFCGNVHNAQWIGFVAEHPQMTLTADVFDCVGANNGFGLQIAVLGMANNSCDESNLYGIACHGTGNESEIVLNLDNLVPGTVYYIVVDGWWTDICKYTFHADPPLTGIQEPPVPALVGPEVVQAGSVSTYTTNFEETPYITHNPCNNPLIYCEGVTPCEWELTYTWTAPPGTTVIPVAPGDEAIIIWGTTPGQVCVTVENPCRPTTQLCVGVEVVNADTIACMLDVPVPPGETCADAPFLCGSVLHGYCSDNTGSTADVPGNLSNVLSCQINSNQWFRFTPCATSVDLAVKVSGCFIGPSLELSVLQADDCDNFRSFVECEPLLNAVTTTVHIPGLTPGEEYFLMIDGVGAFHCSYQFLVLDGISLEAPEYKETTAGFITGPSEVCPEEQPEFSLVPPVCLPQFADGCSFPASLADELRWEWHLPAGMKFLSDSVNVLTIQVAITDTTGGNIFVTFTTEDHQSDVVCAFGIGDCGNIPPFPVKINYVINQLPPVTICADETFTFCGQSYNQSQTIVCPEYCGESVQEIIVLPLDTIVLPVVEICEGECYNFCGTDYCGNQSTLLSCRVGCEVQMQPVEVHPKVVHDFGTEQFCAGECYSFQGQDFCTPGLYELEIPGAFGCDETYRIQLQYYTPPVLITSVATTDCEVNSHFYQVSFSIQNGVAPFLINGQQINGNIFTSDWIANGVAYFYEITDSDFCPATTSLQGSFDCTDLCQTEAGTLQGLNLVSCGDETVSVQAGNDLVLDGNDTYEFLLHDGTANTLGNIFERNATGTFTFAPAAMQHSQTYFISLIAGNNTAGVVDVSDACHSISTGLPVVFYEVPLAEATAEGILTCDVTEVFVSSGNPIADADYSWTGPTGFTSIAATFNASLPGLYQLSVTTRDGCVIQSEVLVEENINPPLVDAGADLELNCSTTEVTLQGSVQMENGGGEYFWQTNTGHFLDTISRLSPRVDAPGMYYLYAINRVNGCEAIDSVEVVANDVRPENMVLDIHQPECFGETNGHIQVMAVEGGTPPFLYSLDGQTYSASPLFSGLAPGNYQLWMQDAKGCEIERDVVLQQPAERVVDLGDEIIYAGLGEDIYLQANTNFNPAQIIWTSESGQVWEGTNEVSLPNVLDNDIISVEAIDENGCVATDVIRLTVDKRPDIFIPNVFSPNGDGENDFFTVYSDQTVFAIKSLTIFSRWGEVVYVKADFPANAPLDGWDGTYNGKLLSDGVFVYKVELELINGESKMYAGDLMLLR